MYVCSCSGIIFILLCNKGETCLDEIFVLVLKLSNQNSNCHLAVLHMNKPLNHRCHMRTQWVIPVVCIHGFYLAALIGITRTVQHIEFRFHEFKDLLQGIIVSSVAIGIC